MKANCNHGHVGPLLRFLDGAVYCKGCGLRMSDKAVQDYQGIRAQVEMIKHHALQVAAQYRTTK